MTSSFKKWPQFAVLAMSILIGKYSGINLLLPAVMIGIFYFLMTKVILKNDENPYLVAASFLFGHAAWISIGTIVVMATMGEASSFAAVGNLIECLIYFLITFCAYMTFFNLPKSERSAAGKIKNVAKPKPVLRRSIYALLDDEPRHSYCEPFLNPAPSSAVAQDVRWRSYIPRTSSIDLRNSFSFVLL